MADAKHTTGRHPFRVEPVRLREIGGAKWESWCVRIATYERRTQDGRCAIHEASSWRTTTVARVDGDYITSPSGKRKAFRTEKAAARAAIAKAEGRE